MKHTISGERAYKLKQFCESKGFRNWHKVIDEAIDEFLANNSTSNSIQKGAQNDSKIFRKK